MYTQEEIQAIVRLWKNGDTINAIARAIQRDPSNVGKKIRSMIANGTIYARDIPAYKPKQVDWLALRLAFRAECRRIMAQATNGRK